MKGTPPDAPPPDADSLRHGFRSTVGRRLLIGIVLFSSLLTFLLTANELYHVYRNDVSAIEKRLNEIRVTHIDSLSAQLWVMNDRMVLQTLNGIARLPEISYVEVTDESGRVLTSGTRPREETVERNYRLNQPYRGTALPIGELQVSASLMPARQRVIDRIGMTLLNNGIKTFLVSIFALLLIHVVVTRRLGQIARFCRAYHLHKPIPALSLPRKSTRRRQDELDDVGVAIEGMVSRIEQSYTDLGRREELYRRIVETAEEGIWLLDKSDRTTFVNPKMSEILGYSDEEMIGREMQSFVASNVPGVSNRADELIDTTNKEPRETALRHKDGSIIPVLVGTAPIERIEAGQRGTLAMVTDISRHKEAEAEIEKLAFFDPLTDLPNRSYVTKRLTAALHRSRRRGSYGALLFLDLDNFKAINDSMGHSFGDEVLHAVGQRLTGTVRGEDTVGRLGGDEFVVVLSDMSTSKDAAAADCASIANKLIECITNPIEIDGRELRIGASIGITIFDGNQTAEDALRRADTALYRAKAEYRNGFAFYNASMGVAADHRLSLERGLRGALRADRLSMVYQPIICIESNRVIGIEALMRWTHEQHGPISPEVFISIAEDTGLIHEIGQWGLHRACTEMAGLLASLGPESKPYLSFNVSPKEIREADFVDRVRDTLRATGMPADRLKLEITERIAVAYTEESIPHMQELNRHGITFAVDDFGTGYSSLSYLKSLPLSTLKIDRAFVNDLIDSPDDGAIVDTVVDIASHFGLELIAEGVETTQQRDILRSKGCLAYQGYLFARPMPMSELMGVLASEQ